MEVLIDQNLLVVLSKVNLDPSFEIHPPRSSAPHSSIYYPETPLTHLFCLGSELALHSVGYRSSTPRSACIL